MGTTATPFAAGYTASKAQSGLGSLLQVNGGGASPPTWTTIGEVIEGTMSPKNLFDDTTNLQSTAKEFLAVLPDPGKVTMTMNRVSNDPGQVFMQGSFQNRTRLQYQLVLPVNVAAGQTTTGDVYGFLAYVEDLAPDIKTDKKLVSKFTLQVTGGITLTVGT
jgi:hypothetical protein